MVVPGSGLVKEQAEAEGLDKIFLAAGFEWREPGCSMCLAMNPDRLAPGERCASTSNRNFEGRQGFKGRTHLVSPGHGGGGGDRRAFRRLAHIQLSRRTAMDGDELRAFRRRLKEKYKADENAALVTLKAQGDLSGEGLACKVSTSRALIEAGLHPATGGSGMQACSGDMLLEALVACAGVTLKAVATALDFQADAAARCARKAISTFAARSASPRTQPSALPIFGCVFDLDTDEPQERIDALTRLTERYCVVFQTLAKPPKLALTVKAKRPMGSIKPPAVDWSARKAPTLAEFEALADGRLSPPAGKFFARLRRTGDQDRGFSRRGRPARIRGGIRIRTARPVSRRGAGADRRRPDRAISQHGVICFAAPSLTPGPRATRLSAI